VTSTEASSEPRASEPHPHRWRILSVTLVIGFMALLDVTIVNVAIPSMQSGLGTSPEAVQWVVSGYALTFGLVLVAGGRLGDVHGRRIMLLVGLIAFVISSAAVGLAPTAELVVVARLVQGVAAGLLTPQSSGLIQQLFSGPERGVAFGYFGTTVGIASAAGPILGGALIALFGAENGWRWVFGINVPIGLVALVLVWRWVPRRPRAQGESAAQRHLDVVGALLLGAAVLCVLLPTIEAQSGNGRVFLLALGAPVFVVAFVLWERRERTSGRAPLLDIELLRHTPGYASGIAVGTVYFTGFTGIFLVLSIFLQDEVGYSPLQAGLLLTPFAVGAAVMAPIAGRLVSRIGRRITVLAVAVVLVGLLALLIALPAQPEAVSWPWVVIPLLVAGLGGGAVISPNQTLSLNDVPPRMGGAAGAVLQTGQRIGSALGAAALVTAYRVPLDSGVEAGTAVQIAIGCSLVILTLALAVAIWDQHHR
jgi:EmrB/QacA subfamily drug resistance transporter